MADDRALVWRIGGERPGEQITSLVAEAPAEEIIGSHPRAHGLVNDGAVQVGNRVCGTDIDIHTWRSRRRGDAQGVANAGGESDSVAVEGAVADSGIKVNGV